MWIKKSVFWVFIGSICFMSNVRCLQAQAYIQWTDKAAGTSLKATLDDFRQIGLQNPEVAKALGELRESLAIVFVPGILGSSLTDANGRVIFGSLSEPSTIISRLELPSDLVDETTESGLEAKLLRSLGPVDIYGDAIDGIQKWATVNRIKFVTCGYDWRRDIRSGARDLERCIARIDVKQRDLVILAHSMGGLVSWTWVAKHDLGEYSPNRRLLQLTLLGSPLAGSCEIVRMVQSGYVQPSRDQKLRVRSDFKPLTYITEKMVDAFENGVAAQLTQGIRPLVLTWPGALELSPAPSPVAEKVSCVGIPAGDDQPTATTAISYYDPAFWALPAGKQMLRKDGGPDSDSYSLPASLPLVLSKAKEFRSGFKALPLRSPSWLYYSRVWMVPDEAGYKAPYVSEAAQWTTDWGDGRVPYLSAMNYPDAYVFSYKVGVESVHGNLPGDPNFFEDYFGNRLPQMLAAIWAADMMDAAAGHPSWIKTFASLNTPAAEVNQLRAAIEPSGTSGRESELLTSALSRARQFNSLVCKERGDCATSYAVAKARVAASPPAVSGYTALKQYSAAARALGGDHPHFAFAEGNRGLELARRMDWAAASKSMQLAEESLESTLSRKATPSAADISFSNTLQRNLAKSLVESGQCKAAGRYLRATVDSWSYAKEALARPCNDVESGLQYCFDIDDYCRNM